MKYLFRTAVLAGLAAGTAVPTHAQSFVIAPELWDRPRSGTAIMERAAVRQAVAAWLAAPGARIVVHHGPGHESALQAEEIRAWLIALAIEAQRVSLRDDLKPAEPLRLDIVRD